MNNNFAKILSSFAMAGVLSFTGVAAQAAEAVGTECADTLSISSCAANIKRIYTANYPEQEDVIDEIINTITSSDEFVYCFETDGAKAFQIVEDSLRDALIPTASTLSYGNGVYKAKVDFNAIMQSNNYYCGPASVLQALTGNGVVSGYNSYNSSAKQAEIAKAMGTTEEDGTYIGAISAYMRTMFPAKNGYEYKAKGFTCNTYKTAIELVKVSLQQNAVPIIRIPDTSVLTYYGGLKQKHYVCISEVDTKNNTVTLVDPNNTVKDGKTPYYGTHTISISQFEKLVDYDGWIALYTSAADGWYVYE